MCEKKRGPEWEKTNSNEEWKLETGENKEDASSLVISLKDEYLSTAAVNMWRNKQGRRTERALTKIKIDSGGVPPLCVVTKNCKMCVATDIENRVCVCGDVRWEIKRDERL